MKEIVVDARMIEVTGVGTYIQNILSRLIEAPFNWKVIVSSETITRFPWLQKVQHLQLNTPFYTLREQIDLPLIIPRCDLFWSPNLNVPVLPIRAKKRLATIHDLNLLSSPSQMQRSEKWLARMLLHRAAFTSNAVITVSLFSRREIEKYLGLRANRVHVIGHGVDREIFSDRPVQDLTIKARYTLPNQFFLFVGNVKSHKNLPKLVLALEKSGHLRHDLVVVGRKEVATRGDDLSTMLRGNPKLRQKIHFLGYIPREDLPALYRLASAFVMPSLYEGFGLPILEAMSCGCPVLTSDRASLPEVGGSHAIYVDPESTDSIALGLEEVLKKREALRREGIEWCRQFSWDQAAKQHLQVMEWVLNQR